ncbi:Phosphoglycerate mutase [Candidatus Terasakiella magnetica]|uniref:Phosphoglycerate mutase n=1 Tax=Candidatus Terasakiella magnetica TaxID=1867952 RepID=A0A1C3RH19_9PROT|nr:histidine phosphatase family protein [Candidatus Terasakiella magnetica]SCA56593.1 Phosphoglycerate mutase [Candidatus Terasakiella magnetica]
MSQRIAVLIRHGDYHQLADTPSAFQPFALNEDGFKQAHGAVAKLEKMAQEENWIFDPEIHSSNLLRAWQTADVICTEMPAFSCVQGFDDLAERGVGSAANLTVSQIEDILEQDPRFESPPSNWKSNSHYRLPLQGAESLMDAGKRVAGHIQQSINQLKVPEGKNIAKVFVAHGAAFRHAAHILGVLAFDDIAKLSMYHADPVALAYDDDKGWWHLCGDWKLRQPKEDYKD